MNQQQPLFDERLFAVIKKVDVGFDEVEWMQDHLVINRSERELFLNNETENPKFYYRAQNPRPGYLEELAEAELLVEESEAPEVVIDLYRRKIERLKLRHRLIEASLKGDNQEFFGLSKKIYGATNKKTFSYVAKQVQSLCHNAKSQHKTVARRLATVFHRVNTSGVTISPDILTEPLDNSRLVTSALEVKQVFADALNQYEINNWTIKIDDTGTRRIFSVRQRDRQIIIPCDEQLFARSKPLTELHLHAIAEHEVGVHVRRAVRAERCPLRLLTVGLDGYLVGEEGLASYVQQQIEGATEFYGFDRYLAASLAVGMDGEARDFRSVFSLMTDYYTLKFDDNTSEQAKGLPPFKASWDVCVRIFRGTTGQEAGCIYTKDIVYLEGNIGIWNFLIEKPCAFEHLFVGKFNPLNQRHVKTLQTLEIVPQW